MGKRRHWASDVASRGDWPGAFKRQTGVDMDSDERLWKAAHGVGADNRLIPEYWRTPGPRPAHRPEDAFFNACVLATVAVVDDMLGTAGTDRHDWQAVTWAMMSAWYVRKRRDGFSAIRRIEDFRDQIKNAYYNAMRRRRRASSKTTSDASFTTSTGR
jgi:hypothetical protein